MSENWVDGSLESGADDEGTLENPGPQAGAELGLADGEPNSFEPEEADPAVSPEPAESED